MPLKLTITNHGVETDYSKFVDWKSIKIEESINLPSQCSFSLEPFGAFTLPPARGYVKIISTDYNKSLYTGYIASQPVANYKALAATDVSRGFQHFRYDVICTSDELLLNTKAIPFIPAYINRTQGQILTDIAETLCPGFFDTSLIASGDLVPFFEYDPKQSWCEVAKQFADGSRYRYKVRDKQIVFQPYADNFLGIEYNESTQNQGQFSPKDLDTQVLAVPIVNDVTIIGDAEAGNNWEDYIVGDGFTGNFQLRHRVFRGASTVLVQESWQNASLNTQQWYMEDPGDNFDLSAGALNIVTAPGIIPVLGESYLGLNNGLELAGGINIESGEFLFNGACDGIIGGVYTEQVYTEANLIAGFRLSSPGVIVGPGVCGGVQGVEISPTVLGAPAGTITTQRNHSYVLQMLITAPQYTRYERTYRTIDGEEYGGGSTTTKGAITFLVQDYDMFAATGFYYTPEITRFTVNADLPPFAAFALINNKELNLTDSYTTVAQMPMGTLQAMTGPLGSARPTGAILPMLPPLSGGYIGPVLPWGAQASANILPPPLPLITGEKTNLVMGVGFQLQDAQITPGDSADTLAFYAQSLPAAGTRVRMQTWESQASVSRLQDPTSIADEAYVVGDDGIRSAIVPDLNPLPRTSEDCDHAAQAFLADRTGTYYNGRYDCTSLFFNPTSGDVQWYPTCGRFLHVHAPYRGITNQKYLVARLTTSILDPQTELLYFSLDFGADLYLEKVLKNFVDLKPVGVLVSDDKALPPNPRTLGQAATGSYLADLKDVQVDMNYVNSTLLTVNVNDDYTGPIEVRRSDKNWGRGVTPDFVALVSGPTFQLTRQQFDQTWYMRPVSGGMTSRRSKVIRTRIPTRPSSPRIVSLADSGEIQFNYNGDMRNIYGFELRTAPQVGVKKKLLAAASGVVLANVDDWTIYYNTIGEPVIDEFIVNDLFFPDGRPDSVDEYPLYTADEYINVLIAGEVVSAFDLYDGQVVLYQQVANNYGILDVDLFGATPFTALSGYPFEEIDLYAYFFNSLWEYSIPTQFTFFGAASGIPPYPWSTSGAGAFCSGEIMRFPNFGLRQKLMYDVNGFVSPQLVIDGQMIVNTFDQNTPAPTFTLGYEAVASGIPGGTTVKVGVWAIDPPNGSGSSQMSIQTLSLPADAQEYSVTVSGVGFHATTDWGFCAITTDSAMGWFGPTGIPLQGDNELSAYTFTSAGDFGSNRGFINVPDHNFRQFRIEARHNYKCGVLGNPMVFIPSGSGTTFVSGVASGAPTSRYADGTPVLPAGTGWVPNSFSGRFFGVLSMADPTEPLAFVDLPIIGNDETMLEVSGDISFLASGCIGYVKTKATAYSPTSLTDDLFLTSWLPKAALPGLDPHLHAGQLLTITRGQGFPQDPRMVQDNDQTTIYLAEPLDPPPGPDTEFSVIDPIIGYQLETHELVAGNTATPIVLAVTVDNSWNAFHIVARTENHLGVLSEWKYSPFREIWQPGFAVGSSGKVYMGPPQAEFVFGIGTDGDAADLVVGSTTNLVIVKTSGILTGWDAVCEEAPSGGDSIIAIYVNHAGGAQTELCQIVLPADDLEVQSVTQYVAPVKMIPGDTLQGEVLSVAEGSPGKRVTVYLYWSSGTSTESGSPVGSQ